MEDGETETEPGITDGVISSTQSHVRSIILSSPLTCRIMPVLGERLHLQPGQAVFYQDGDVDVLREITVLVTGFGVCRVNQLHERTADLSHGGVWMPIPLLRS